MSSLTTPKFASGEVASPASLGDSEGTSPAGLQDSNISKQAHSDSLSSVSSNESQESGDAYVDETAPVSKELQSLAGGPATGRKDGDMESLEARLRRYSFDIAQYTLDQFEKNPEGVQADDRTAAKASSKSKQ